MNKIEIILAESSDILLNGLQHTLLCNPCVEVKGKATRFNTLCREIENVEHDVVVLGPIITQRYPQDLINSLLVKYPGIKIVEIEIEDHQARLMDKIIEAVSVQFCKAG
jgi:hypothetical protein